MTDRTRTDLDEVERILVGHLVADHAPGFYGQRGALHFGLADAVRYTAEGYVEKALPDVDRNTLWDLVAAEIDAHPEILTGHPVPDVELKARAAARAAAAKMHDDLAGEAFKAGDYPLAAAHVDAAERADPRPGDLRSWDALRDLVARKHAAMLHDEAAGAAAYEADEPRAPGIDRHVLSRIGNTEVGDPRNRLVMEAWLRGYDRAADAAATAAIA